MHANHTRGSLLTVLTYSTPRQRTEHSRSSETLLRRISRGLLLLRIDSSIVKRRPDYNHWQFLLEKNRWLSQHQQDGKQEENDKIPRKLNDH